MKYNQCKVCEKHRDGEYFNSVNGHICAECLKKNGVFFGLKKLGLIKNARKKLTEF